MLTWSFSSFPRETGAVGTFESPISRRLAVKLNTKLSSRNFVAINRSIHCSFSCKGSCFLCALRTRRPQHSLRAYSLRAHRLRDSANVRTTSQWCVYPNELIADVSRSQSPSQRTRWARGILVQVSQAFFPYTARHRTAAMSLHQLPSEQVAARVTPSWRAHAPTHML